MSGLRVIFAPIVGLTLLVLGTSAWEPRLVETRRELKLATPVPEGVENSDPESARATLVGATLGVARPIVVNFLVLRSRSLEREGRFFESAALSRAVVTLLPRLPRVWTFHASKLAFDISSEVPISDRYSWVAEGIRLLRDDARKMGLRSPRVYTTLSQLFFQRIGDLTDPAHLRFKEALATAFEVPRSELPAAFREWKLDVSRWRALSRRVSGNAKFLLDPRSTFSHSLYWAEVGLSTTDASADLWAESRLRHFFAFSIRRLAASGFIVPQPGGGDRYVFLPDPRFHEPALRTFQEQLQRYRDQPEIISDLEDDFRTYTPWAILQAAVWARFDTARELLRSSVSLTETWGEQFGALLGGALCEEIEAWSARDFRHLEGLVRARLGAQIVASEHRAVVGAPLDLADVARGLHFLA
ncbi:MAG: hypothetical protein AAF517_06480, partial [Planctomycetota bacterium]